MEKVIGFNFLPDLPLGADQEGASDFYHKKVVPALKEILDNDSCVHTIGLFSHWGTGKSTIIKMLQSQINYPMFVFDAWKYQDDSLRRIFLIELVKFLKKEGVHIEDRILDPLYISKELHLQQEVGAPSTKLTRWQKLWKLLTTNWAFLSAVGLLAIWMILDSVFGEENIVIQVIKNVFAAIGSVTLLGLLVVPIFEKIWQRSVEKFMSSLGPLSVMRTKVEKEERINSPEEFESLFKQIVDRVDKKIVIVFDNIDRVQGDVAIRILSTIKTFLDPERSEGLTFIIPCDSEAIESQIKSFYKDKQIENFDPSEYLRKLFNVVIWLPEFILSDLQKYIDKVIEDTGEVKKLLKDEDVTFVIGSAFSKNPREIKQFVNNLIAALVLASKTEVAARINGNVAYLAKVLVLRQKYPDAYLRLKDHWYEPENILHDNDPAELRSFMITTIPITVPNAEPFIYFKEPAVFEKLKNSEDLTTALVKGDKEKTKEIVKGQSTTEVIEFIKLLLSKYRNQKELLFNIFTTQLEVLAEQKIVTASKSYYKTLAQAINADLWEFYTKLPTDLVFSEILGKAQLDDQYRKPIIQRYALSLGNEELLKPENAKFVKDVLLNLKSSVKYIDPDDLRTIKSSIKEHFSTNAEVVALFENVEEQEAFIAPQAFEKFIGVIDNNSFLKNADIILLYKDYVIKNNQLNNILLKTFEVLQKETTEFPDHRPEKEVLISKFNDIFSEFGDQLEGISGETKNQLVDLLIQAFSSIGAWDNRWSLVNSLRWLSLHITDPKKGEANNKISEFFQQASGKRIGDVLDYWQKSSAKIFINDFFPALETRSIKDSEVLDVIYTRVDKKEKLELLTKLIDQSGAGSLEYLKKLGSNLPDRQMLIKALISKLPSLPFESQVLIYDYLPGQLSKSDPVDLKEPLVNNIKTLLKSDVPASQETGYKTITSSDFLSDEKKREIAKDTLGWLRQPGKGINSNHRFALKTISNLVKVMQDTPVRDFTYTVFNTLKQDQDKATLEVSLEVLDEVRPQYLNHENDFKDLLDRLRVWPNDENKKLVVERVGKYRSSNSKKDEKDFWKEFDSLDSPTGSDSEKNEK